MMAQQEALGDLKLYRIPEPVTVAARSQKQVALLQRADVRASMVYRQRLFPTDYSATGPAQRVLVTRNRTAEGLGLPLPAGPLMLFTEDEPRPILLGRGIMTDHAVGEDVEIALGPAVGVTTRLAVIGRTRTRSDYELVVTNDRDEPIRFEAEIAPAIWRFAAQTRLSRRNGMPLWTITVPAHGTARLPYSLSRPH